MTKLVVDFPQLQGAIDHMAEFGREVAEVLEEIDQAVAALRANWEGQASDTQAQTQQQWEDGAEQMKKSLESLRQVADNARKNYADAVDKNGKMWAG
ncbi:WXG100 family type VII secretion target [Mycolicibacterium neoaurum]|jgi:WXG100 family type VII secretion target|uniref:ESAT-6-like protein n=1 Tax=Mycolicibacterium neoaurum TaxID=1795 RepID=A0AAV2WUJ1_MYCNE|nr:WXG100 family type VII secretion target [Mycolicibacterium neoaurum]QVI28728.1 WXG100 family type VII secretion target [Mycolicibacterium neoaurum]TLH48838.1 WXG100 family type VII secretion target [Mycolicibacterium neoaurum]CDQ47326.1 putative ESAT-6-like protein 12 [Mycolicibacterium neoaurum]SDC21022.1 WXG100 family type VII secretion target [Mycolicibacterium neoaurum]